MPSSGKMKTGEAATVQLLPRFSNPSSSVTENIYTKFSKIVLLDSHTQMFHYFESWVAITMVNFIPKFNLMRVQCTSGPKGSRADRFHFSSMRVLPPAAAVLRFYTITSPAIRSPPLWMHKTSMFARFRCTAQQLSTEQMCRTERRAQKRNKASG